VPAPNGAGILIHMGNCIVKHIGMLLGLAAGLTLTGQTLSGQALAQVPVSPDITAAFATYDRVTLLVGLLPPDPVALPGADAATLNAARTQAIRDRQQAVIDAIGPDLAVDTRYATIPALAVQVTAAGLAALQAHPLVTSIAPNRLRAPADEKGASRLALAPRPIDPARAEGLAVTTPAAPQGDARIGAAPAARPPAPTSATRMAQPDNLQRIGAPALWDVGRVGAGKFVAVLDTGIEASHPAFTGKTVLEACFSVNDPAEGAFSLCPGRAPGAIGPGTASACPDTSLVASCRHGTHVAGIATGNDPAAGVYGVAPQADVIAVQVFARIWDERNRRWALSAPTIDSVAGLDYVASFAQANPGRVASVNMSLGGDEPMRNFCDTSETDDEGDIVTSMMIDRLRDLGVTTAIAAGNEDFRGAIGAPACVTPAVAVAATNANDTYSVNAGTNLAAFPLVFIAAPGDLILSAIPGHGYARFSGTSMATPMVAGALALLQAAHPGLQAFDYETTLVRSGRSLVLDGRFRLPRLDLVMADAMLSGNVSGGSLSQPYQPNSPVSYVQSPARGNTAWRWYKQQLYVP